MPGTQDYMLRQAEEKAARATAAREQAGRADSSNGGLQRFRDAQSAEAKALRELSEARTKYAR
jgi:hypothetical protein